MQLASARRERLMLAPSMSLSPVFWVALSDPARSISDSLANFLNKIVCEETCEQEQIWGEIKP